MGLSQLFSVFFFLSLLTRVPASGATNPTQSEDKSQYTLFNPTPRSQMRPFITDRPDKTEAAHTVDAGHFQFEMDLWNQVQNDTEGQRQTSSLFLAPNLKVGLTNRIDFQLIVESLTRYESSSGSTSGLGDILPRLKINVFGNDSGDIALALMPYVKIPTAQSPLGNGVWEGGLIAPVAFELPADFGLGAMIQWDWIGNSDSAGRHLEFIHSVTLGRDIIDTWAFYVEYWGNQSFEEASAYRATFDVGTTWEVIPDWQLDAGINIGLTKASDDLNPFIGISARF